jgi:hypothetical protein
MFTIRPFNYSEADYEALEAVEKLVFDEFARPAQQWRHFDEIRNSELVYQRDVIEADGVVVAIGDYGHWPWAYHPRKFRMLLMVHPEHDDSALRPLYHEHVLQVAAPYDLVAIQAGMREDKTTDISFLRESGFVLVSRMPLSMLAVPGFNAAAYDDLLQTVAGQGIAIKTLRELQSTDPDWLPKIA